MGLVIRKASLVAQRFIRIRVCSGPSLLNVASGELLWFSRLSDYALLSGMKGASSSSPSSIWVGGGG